MFFCAFLSITDNLYIGLVGRVFANSSILGRVIPITQIMVLDAALLKTLHYKVRIKGKVEPARESAHPHTSM